MRQLLKVTLTWEGNGREKIRNEMIKTKGDLNHVDELMSIERKDQVILWALIKENGVVIERNWWKNKKTSEEFRLEFITKNPVQFDFKKINQDSINSWYFASKIWKTLRANHNSFNGKEKAWWEHSVW